MPILKIVNDVDYTAIERLLGRDSGVCLISESFAKLLGVREDVNDLDISYPFDATRSVTVDFVTEDAYDLQEVIKTVIRTS